ncbi:hypothetical protein, partial [Lentilactobacillus parafarraginis]|uniref:hypothetical protein n=1 Tax=Lentilactobacillus parafarraginis TaxID=390842 RepID=UPI001C658414
MSCQYPSAGANQTPFQRVAAGRKVKNQLTKKSPLSITASEDKHRRFIKLTIIITSDHLLKPSSRKDVNSNHL